MNHIKYFESFNPIESQSDEQTVPEYNPDLNLRVKKYVEENFEKNPTAILSIAGMEYPKGLDKVKFDAYFDEAKQRAVKYFIKNPEQMKLNPEFAIVKVDSDPIPKVQTI